ncbi:MAG TPA: hypothetical protein VF183_07365 [Acidimicrobiales bacterium]
MKLLKGGKADLPFITSDFSQLEARIAAETVRQYAAPSVPVHRFLAKYSRGWVWETIDEMDEVTIDPMAGTEIRRKRTRLTWRYEGARVDAWVMGRRDGSVGAHVTVFDLAPAAQRSPERDHRGNLVLVSPFKPFGSGPVRTPVETPPRWSAAIASSYFKDADHAYEAQLDVHRLIERFRVEVRAERLTQQVPT